MALKVAVLFVAVMAVVVFVIEMFREIVVVVVDCSANTTKKIQISKLNKSSTSN